MGIFFCRFEFEIFYLWYFNLKYEFCIDCNGYFLKCFIFFYLIFSICNNKKEDFYVIVFFIFFEFYLLFGLVGLLEFDLLLEVILYLDLRLWVKNKFIKVFDDKF